jgi:hypothetical protein
MDGGEIRVPFKLTFTKVKKKKREMGTVALLSASSLRRLRQEDLDLRPAWAT